MSTSTPRLSFLPDFPGRERLYQPLDASKMEIRVIELEPSTEPSAPISCYMQTISIAHEAHRPPRFGYNAISYFWGSTEPDNRDTVTVRNESTTTDGDQNYEVPVTKNLTGALRQFRAQATAFGRIAVIWADAICINQLDARERSQQVVIMRDIYAYADWVLVWLGESNPMAEKGLASLFDLVRCEHVNQPGGHRDCIVVADLENGAQSDLKSLHNMWNSIPDNYCNRATLDAFFKEIPSWLSNKDVVEWTQAVAALFRLNYWYRAWVVQEVRANPHIALHCGQTCRLVWNLDHFIHLLQPNRVALTALSLLTRSPELLHVLDFFNIQTSPGNFQKMKHIVRSLRVNPTIRQRYSGYAQRIITHSLEECFLSNMRRAADPRDYVYARLGWSEGFTALLLKPKYNTSTEDVFTSTTVEVLRHTQSWSHCHFFDPSASPYLPSWAIDFSNLGPLDLNEPHFTSFHLVKRYFRAHLSAKVRLSNPRPGLLLTGGFVMDQVAAIAPLHCRALATRCSLEEKVRLAKDAMAKLIEYLESDIHQRYFTKNDRMPSRNDVFKAFASALYVGCYSPDADFEQDMQAIHSRDKDYLRKYIFPSMTLAATTIDNRFIITQRGHIGLAPPNIQIDDHIAILAGGCMPFAIRKVGEEKVGTQQHDTHILLGACYIYGIMHGEAVHQRAKEVYEAPKNFSSSPAGNLIFDARLHHDQGFVHGEAVQRRAKEVYEAPRKFSSPAAGDLITDSRLHLDQGAPTGPIDELAFLNDICLV